jgi:hypothetical protein
MPFQLWPPSNQLQAALELGWRTLLVGVALFVAPPLASAPLPEHQALALLGVVIWCYYDGVFWRCSWPAAVLERGLWSFLAIKWVQVLLIIFGNPQV